MKIELVWKPDNNILNFKVRRFPTVKKAEEWYEKNLKGLIISAYLRRYDGFKVLRHKTLKEE